MRAVSKQNTNFHLPGLGTTPVVCIATGTGIAPFRAFWQERKHVKTKHGLELGPFVLILGFRTKQKFLYEEEINEALSAGIITKLLVAFSREPDQEKEYVQDVLAKEETK